jgi:hypothetical protein
MKRIVNDLFDLDQASINIFLSKLAFDGVQASISQINVGKIRYCTLCCAVLGFPAALISSLPLNV